jgi:hypothetical protein
MAEPQLLPAQLNCLGTHFKHFGIPRSLGNLKSITTAQKIKISHHISWNSMILLVYVDFHPFTCKSEIHGKLLNGLAGNTATSGTAREPFHGLE